jgi:hypothetical protein
MLAGTLGGLLQDIFPAARGVSGPVNTIVGPARSAHVSSGQGARPRAHRRGRHARHYLMAPLRGVIAQTWPVIVWTAMLEAVVINAVVAGSRSI